MTPLFLGIRKQLLGFIIIILVPVAILLWYTWHDQRRQAIAYADLQVDQSVRNFSNLHQLVIERTERLLSIMSRLPAVRQADGRECSAELAEMHADYPEYATMVVADPKGMITCCALPLKSPLNVADREWFQRTLKKQQFVVGNFVISRSSGKASLPFSYPVMDDDGTLRSIVGAALDLSTYDRLLAESPLPAGAHVLVTDQRGTILYASAPGRELKGKLLKDFPDHGLPAGDAADKHNRRTEDGDYIHWHRSLTVGPENNGIFLVVGIPREAVYAKANAQLKLYSLALLAALLLTAAIAWFYAGRLIVSPIQTLVDRTRRIGSGRLEATAAEARLTGEFRILADAFSEMTRQLAQREMEHNTAEKALRESEQRYRALFEQSPISLWEEDLSALKTHLDDLTARGVTDFDAYFNEDPERMRYCLRLVKILHVNQATMTLYEAKTEEELLGSLDRIVPRSSQHLLQAEMVAIAEGRPFTIEGENSTLNGRTFPAMINSSLPVGYEKSWARVFFSVFDLTDRYRVEQQRKDLERQLLLAQKMETVGTLAGGIAHDFNNILSPIIGYAELSLSSDELKPRIRSNLTGILTAAQRAKEMVHQILAFSRRQEISKQPVDLREITREVLELLRSSIPSTIEIRAELEDGLRPVIGDGSRIHQIIMNLCTNGYQALKTTGGVITIGIRQSPLVADGQPVRIKPHLLLFVEDTGPGIPPELQERIFDPFFTTKGPGEGTGMGLAVVHGIVKDHGGAIEVESEPGDGTRFNIYLPCAEHSAAIAQKPVNEERPTGSEHIMVIDDEEQLVTVLHATLNSLGYTVSSYTSSVEALEHFRGRPERFDLLLTDQTMPDLTGMETAREMLVIRPDLPIILCTGFSETTDPEQAMRFGIRKFLHKPVGSAQLATAIREVLDAKIRL